MLRAKRSAGRFLAQIERLSFLSHHFLSMEFKATGQPDPNTERVAPGVVYTLRGWKGIGAANTVNQSDTMAQGGAMLVGADTGARSHRSTNSPFPFQRLHQARHCDVSGERSWTTSRMRARSPKNEFWTVMVWNELHCIATKPSSRSPHEYRLRQFTSCRVDEG